MDSNLFFEFLGTALMILLGLGVVANVVLPKTKGNGGGWVVITFAWGFAVFVGAYVAQPSGAHLNPCVTLGLTLAGQFKGNVIGYIIAQMCGGMFGALLTYLFYKPHFDLEENPDNKLGVFCTAPAVRSYGYNFLGEFIATYVLLLGILFAGQSMIAGAFPVGILIVAIGMSLGGTTGYAMNPARDLAPRIMHLILPIKGKRDSDWAYAWVPFFGPLLGGSLAGLTYSLLQTLEIVL